MRSMTGFGRAVVENKNFRITVEIRSVNNKFLDMNIRLPREIGFLEKFTRDQITSKLYRGKVNINVLFDINPDADSDVLINRARLNQYYQTLENVKNELNIESPISLDHLIGVKELFEISAHDLDENEMQKLLSAALNESLDQLNQMRETEGSNLKKDLLKRARIIDEGLEFVRDKGKNNIRMEFDRLYNNIIQLLGEGKVDRQRLEQEIALIADKVDITEECVRMDSHLKLLHETLDRKDDVGKKLTFIMQEMLREANTMNSKSSDVQVQHRVIAMKEEIERLREQVQNIE